MFDGEDMMGDNMLYCVTRKLHTMRCCTRFIVLLFIWALPMLLMAQTCFGASYGAHAMPNQLGVDETFQANEIVVSNPNVSFINGIVDMEFDGRGRFTWVDRRGNVWIGNVDVDTGLFDPTDGRAALVDVDAVTVSEIGNGPEWVFTQAGMQIVYTKHTNSATTLTKASYMNGEWNPRFLRNPRDRLAPVGSLDRNDSSAAISYRGPNYLGDPPSITAQYVRNLNDANSEQMIPTTDEFSVGAARWVPNTQSVIFSRVMPPGPKNHVGRCSFMTWNSSNSSR